MPQWREVSPDFGSSTRAFGDALQQVNTVANVPTQLLKTIEEQKRYDAEQARQKVADERAATLFNQQQDAYKQQLKDRESRIMFEGIKGELLPHLQAQDTRPAEFDGILNSTQQIPTSNYISSEVGSAGKVSIPTISQKNVNLPTPNPEVKFATKERGASEKLPEKSTFRKVVNGMLPISGIGNIMKVGDAILPDPAVSKLLETPGMYTTRPGSSARELNDAGKAALAKGMIPGTIEDKTRSTLFNNIDFSKSYDKNRNPYNKNGDAYFLDKASGQLVNEKSITSALKNVNMKPTKVETVIGTKTISSTSPTKILTDAKQYGMNPEVVKRSYDKIDDGYKQVLNMLPKDNTARRDELRGYLTQIASNLGMDPKDYDINKEVDSILPKSEMSESQKYAANTVIHALDEKKKEIMDNKKLALQEKEMLLNQQYRNASLGLQKLEYEAKKAAIKTTEDTYVKSMKDEAGKLYAKQLLDPTSRSARVDAAMKRLLPEYTHWYGDNNKGLREAAEKQVANEDAYMLEQLKKTQF